jgi:protein-disulfide isomerase
VRGPATAPVTVVLFSEFQCPHSKKMIPAIEELRSFYGPKVRFVFKHFPLPQLHPMSEPAAELALEALAELGAAGFWKAHDALWAVPELDEPSLKAVGAKLGLDPVKVQRAISTQAHRSQIEDDLQLARTLTVGGTPTLFVNGRPAMGARPTDDLEDMVEEALEQAAVLTRRGVRADQVYDELMKTAKDSMPKRR